MSIIHDALPLDSDLEAARGALAALVNRMDQTLDWLALRGPSAAAEPVRDYPAEAEVLAGSLRAVMRIDGDPDGTRLMALLADFDRHHDSPPAVMATWLEGSAVAFGRAVRPLLLTADSAEVELCAVRDLLDVADDLHTEVMFQAAIDRIQLETPKLPPADYAPPAHSEEDIDRLHALACRELEAVQRERNRPRVKRRRRGGEPKVRGLTGLQTEAMQLYADHKGNIAAAARAAGISRQAFEKRYMAACKKMGITPGRGRSPGTVPLPTDGRGQTTASRDARRI